MTIWAIADLHLSFGVPGKEMDLFGEAWKNHAEKIASNWRERIKGDDLVLIPGDISWAMRPEEAVADLQWLDALPGTKLMVKGNHDYWWHSVSKVEKILPPSCHILQNNSFDWKDVSIAGARLWDSDEYSFDQYIAFFEHDKVAAKPHHEEKELHQKIFARELTRLEMSLKTLNPKAEKKIVMTHYPPIGAELKMSKVAALLEKYDVEIALFGHLHSLKAGVELFGEARGIAYFLTACDYLDFSPLQVL